MTHTILVLFLTDKNYDQAVALYSKAIDLASDNAVYYANRSLAYLRQESFGFALSDAELAIKNDANYLKGYYRRAAAQMSLGKFKQALSDFEFVRILLLLLEIMLKCVLIGYDRCRSGIRMTLAQRTSTWSATRL